MIVAARAPGIAASRGDDFLRRLHSLAGIIPLGVFLVVHLATQVAALGGPATYARTAAAGGRAPVLWILELLGIVVPLAFHAGYGLKLFWESRRAAKTSGEDRSREVIVSSHFANLRLQFAQQLSGLFTLAFVAYHLGEYWIPGALGRLGPDAFYTLLSSRLSSTFLGLPVLALAYFVGIGASCFHLTNGLFAFSRSRRPGGAPSKFRRALSFLFVGLGVSLFLLGAGTTMYFATGLRFYAPGGDASATDPRCSMVDRATSNPARAPSPPGSVMAPASSTSSPSLPDQRTR